MATHDGEAIEVRVGLSYISTDQARRNLQREIPHWGFAAVKEQARAEWNRALGFSAAVTPSIRNWISCLWSSMGPRNTAS
jgi:putative alpha-1,2-mannosidase